MLLPQRYVFSSKSQQLINSHGIGYGCCCYHKGTYFQANHNNKKIGLGRIKVVVATTKVRIFKQITTGTDKIRLIKRLLLLPQRYVFSSKSQPSELSSNAAQCCCCYHKGTYFQANHNTHKQRFPPHHVVVATTKVRIFKQITTYEWTLQPPYSLLLLPQRYVFSSKSQPIDLFLSKPIRCCCYHKGTYFQANHNLLMVMLLLMVVVVATTKVRIFKQITTN